MSEIACNKTTTTIATTILLRIDTALALVGLWRKSEVLPTTRGDG